MSLPLSRCLVYKAVLGNDAALQRFMHIMGVNAKHGAFTELPCEHRPPCEIPTQEQFSLFEKRLADMEQTGRIILAEPTECCGAKLLVRCEPDVYKCPCGETKYGYRKESHVHVRPVRGQGEYPRRGTPAQGVARAGVRASDSGAGVVHQACVRSLREEDSEVGNQRPRANSPGVAQNREYLRFLIKLDAADNVSVSDWEMEFIESHVDKAYVDFSPKQRAAIEKMMERYGERIGW